VTLLEYFGRSHCCQTYTSRNLGGNPSQQSLSRAIRIPASHSTPFELSAVFDEMYAAGGRPSIPPERLLKASLLIALYSVRSERAFCEELDYQLLFGWFRDIRDRLRVFLSTH
jgi:Transposase domain (DUF772)